jgi:hypothetical protein
MLTLATTEKYKVTAISNPKRNKGQHVSKE